MMDFPERPGRVCTVALLCAMLSWGCGDGGVPVPGALPDAPGGPASCVAAAAAADGVAVASSDVYGGTPFALGYPPYAVGGCRLAYVARPADGAERGRLVLRDLATLEELELAPPSEEARRPTVGGDVVAWEATVSGKRAVRVFAGGATTTVEGPFDHAGEPRATEDAVVFTAWKTPDERGDTDVFLLLAATAELVPIATGPAQQRFADVSSAKVVYTDFAEDLDGTFDDDGSDLADIGVVDRAGGTAVSRVRIGKQAFPLLADAGKLAYLDWGLVHPEPKFSAYELYVGDVDGAPENDLLVEQIVTSTPYIRPTAGGALVEWVQWPPGDAATLWRRPSNLSTPAEVVGGLDGLELFGPSASAHTTVIAARAPGGEMTLRAFAR